jgi:flagellar hook protein FlgE
MFTNEYSNFIASQTIKSENDSVVETINSKTTNYASSATDDLDTQKGSGYKTKEAKIADIEALTTAYRNELSLYSTLPIEGEAATNQVTNVGFTMGQLSSGIDSVEITVGTTTHKQKFRNDTLTTLQDLADSISSSKMMSASVDANGILQITSMLPGQSVSISNAQILNGAVVATPVPVVTTTEAVVGSGKAKLESIEAALKTAIEDAGGKYLKLSNTIDSSNLENTTMTELQMKLDTLNISDTPFGTAEIENGVMYVKQGDNRFAVGKVTTAVFSNELGLDPQGDNLYASTTKSGDIIFATNENEILGQTLELSNSELSESLVDLMVYQRSFEASSKAVTTSDEFLKTAIQLKK